MIARQLSLTIDTVLTWISIQFLCIVDFDLHTKLGILMLLFFVPNLDMIVSESLDIACACVSAVLINPIGFKSICKTLPINFSLCPSP
jgi:hypothetical protein